MGLGTGIYCDRCGNQVSYDGPYQLKERGDEHNLCSNCVRELKKEKWDKENEEY